MNKFSCFILNKMGNNFCAGKWTFFWCRSKGDVDWGCCANELGEMDDSAFRLERKAEESEDSENFFD